MKNLKKVFEENMWMLQFDTDRMSTSGLEAYKDLEMLIEDYNHNQKQIEANPTIKRPVLKVIHTILSNLYWDYDRVSESGKEALKAMDDAICEEFNKTPSLADQIEDAGSEKVNPETIDTKSKDLEI